MERMKKTYRSRQKRGSRLKKAAALFAVTAMMLISTGCSFTNLSLSAEGTMRPPRPVGDRSEIYSVLEATAGANFTLKYPGSGDYRSAFIMEDLDGDSTQEAIAFYQSADAGGGISVLFIQKVNGIWQSLAGFTNTASQIDKIEFGDVNGDGRKEVIIGWGNASTGSTFLCVYYRQDGYIHELNLEQSYSRMTVMDFDNDGYEEIFTANVALGEQAAVSRLIRIRSGAIEIMGTADMDKTVTQYTNMNAGLLSDSQVGVVLDGARSNQGYVTEVVFWDPETKELKTPLLDPAQQSVIVTVRNNGVLSRDVNNDKLIEFPITTLLPGFTQQGAPETAYLTEWVRYDASGNTLKPIMSTVYNTADGYWFLIPDMWKSEVTTAYNAENRSLTFYRWKKGEPTEEGEVPLGEMGKALLQIRVFTKNQWESVKKNKSAGFIQLLDNNNLIYAAVNFSGYDALSMTDDDVLNSFHLVTQES